MEIHPTKMSQGKNDYKEVIQCLTLKIREGARKAESLPSARIYRVPKRLRKLNESAYTPQLIAIGPLHRNDPHLQTLMQHVKTSYMNNLLCRMTQGMENQEAEQKKILQDCVAAMEESIDDAKKCYAEEVALDVEMMLVDGCFILEFFYRNRLFFDGSYSEEMEAADPIYQNPLTISSVQHDLLLLENQIPFLVLKRLFPLTLARISNHSLEDLSFLGYVCNLMRPEKGKSTNSTGSAKASCWPRDYIRSVLGNQMNNSEPHQEFSTRNANYYHILHKLHNDFLPSDQTGKGRLGEIMPSASELVYAGVKFVPGTGNDLFKVKFTEPEGPFRWFHGARFEIPPLKVQITTEPFLRNFIAFEQCCPGTSEHFTSYAILMGLLVNSEIDVQVLNNAGVMYNWLVDATSLFKMLCQGDKIGQFLFADTCNKATRYSKRFWPKHMAYLRRQYFASPWKFTGSCLALIVFGVTIAQLIVAILK